MANDVQFTMRLDTELQRRMARIAGLRQARTGKRVNTSDVYRDLIRAGLEVLERDEEKRAKRGGK